MSAEENGTPIIGVEPKEKPLKPGPRGECCHTCYFYEEVSGDCRRWPMNAQMVPTMEVNPLTGRPQPQMAKWSVFPKPNKQQVKVIWCGEYKPKLTSK